MAKASGSSRSVWVAYLRVSTSEQAQRELSLPAQRHAVQEYAARRSHSITREYVENGSSGHEREPKAFREMLEDVWLVEGEAPREGLEPPTRWLTATCS